MECYFGSYEREKAGPEGKKSLVCFSIPKAGINFKAPFDSNEDLHSQYASLLTLLEFIELNQKVFKGKSLKIYGNDLEIIKQINEDITVRFEFTDLLQKALD
ncbi:MAG: hypothetical protein ABIJ45_07820, partial [Candidatus Zixiibacteriota bacterium]